MQEKQIEKLNKLLELMQNDTVTPKVLEEFLVLVLSTIQKSKEGFESLSNDNLAKIQGALDYIQSEHEQIVSRVDAKNTSTWARFEGKLQEVTKLLAEIKQIKATPGKDADEEKIVAEVLSKIPKHECKMVECEHEEELGEDIVEKINELPTDDERLKIDAIHIKNLPELTKIYGSNISKAIYQLSDVVLTNLTNNDVLKWDDTNKYWVNGTGGGSGVTTIGTIDSQTPSANGAVISGTSLYMQSASATVPGLINTTTQTFKGEKTFFNSIVTQTVDEYAAAATLEINLLADDIDVLNTAHVAYASINDNFDHLLGTYSGSFNYFKQNGSGTTENCLSSIGQIINIGTGTINNATGFASIISNESTGAISTGTNFRVYANNATTAYGFYNDISGVKNVFTDTEIWNARPFSMYDTGNIGYYRLQNGSSFTWQANKAGTIDFFGDGFQHELTIGSITGASYTRLRSGTGGVNLYSPSFISIEAAAPLRFYNAADSQYVALQAGTLASDTTYTLPTAYPASNGYALVSTTAGVMSWAAMSGGSGSATTYSVTQTAHGFSVGDVIKSAGTANAYAKAQANSAANAEVVGIVTVVTDADNFTYTTEGVITTGVPVATAGTTYFLSPSSAGAMTSTEPTTVGQVSKPLLVVLESGAKAVFAFSIRGEVIGTVAGLAGSTGITVDGGGGVITTGVKGYISIPYSGTITGWTIFSDVSGSCVIDTWKDTYANFPPTVADTIWGGSKPTLSSAQKNQATGLSIAVTQGDVFAYNVDSATTVTRVNLTINITKS